MSDLRRLAQPLLDRPPLEPLPLARLRSRARRRRVRRGAIACGAMLAVVGLVGGVLITQGSDTGRSTVSAGPTAPAPEIAKPEVSTLEVGGATDVAIGAGSVWVPGFDVLRRIDPVANAVSATIPVPGSSDYRSVLFAYGSVWVADTGTGMVTRVDPATNQIVATIPVGWSPGPMAAAGGLLWVAQPGANEPGGTIVPVDPTTSAIGQPLAVHTTVPAPFISLTSDVDTLFAAWGTQLLRIDARTRAIRSLDFTHGTGVNVGDDPVSVLADHGTLYVLTESGRVTAFDATTLAVRRSRPGLQAAQRMAVGGRSLWVLVQPSSDSDSGLLRLDRTTLEPQGAPLPTGLTSVALASTSDTTWVANFNEGTLTRVDTGARTSRPELCPALIPIDRAIADGLPPLESVITDRTEAQGSLRTAEPDLRRRYPDAESFSVGPGFGRAWAHDPEGRVTVLAVEDFAVIVHLRSRADCPSNPGRPPRALRRTTCRSCWPADDAVRDAMDHPPGAASSSIRREKGEVLPPGRSTPKLVHAVSPQFRHRGATSVMDIDPSPSLARVVMQSRSTAPERRLRGVRLRWLQWSTVPRSRRMPASPYFRSDLARIHHEGFGFHADAVAPGILTILEPVLERGGLVLELGCGSGLLTKSLVEAGHRVLAADASPAMVDLARDFVPTVPVEVLRLPDDPLPTADAIVSVGHALSYLDSEEDIDRSLAAMAGALEVSGILAFDICDLEWGAARREQPPGVWFGDDWVLATRRSVIDDRIFRREMTMFVRDGELWRRDDETHDNVLIDTSRLPELLARFGVDAEVRHAFGDEALMSGLVAVVGRRRAT